MLNSLLVDGGVLYTENLYSITSGEHESWLVVSGIDSRKLKPALILPDRRVSKLR